MRVRAFFTMVIAARNLQATAQAQDSLSTDSTLWYNRQSSESRTEFAPVMPSRDGGRGKLNQTQQLGEVVIKSQKPKIRTNLRANTPPIVSTVRASRWMPRSTSRSSTTAWSAD